MEYKWVVLTVTTVGTFMASADSSNVIIALPLIIADLHGTLSEGVWIITIYQFVVTVLALAVGRIADIHGRVKLYIAGYVIYAVGAALSATAVSGTQLILFRAFQGAGASLIFVNGPSLIADAFHVRELGTAYGINFMAFSMGAVAGYSLGGTLATFVGWRAIFVFSFLVGSFGGVWSRIRLHEILERTDKQRFDGAGTSIYTLGLAMILLGLTLGSLKELSNIMLLIMGASLFPVFFLVEQRQTQPILDLELFKNRQFALGNLTGLFMNLSTKSFPFVASLYFQFVRGMEPIDVGVLLISGEIGFAVVTVLSGLLSDRYGSKYFTASGSFTVMVGLLLFAFVGQSSSILLLLLVIVLVGLGRGFFGSPNTGSIMSTVRAERHGIAQGVRSTINNTAGVVSIPLSTALMTLVLPYDRVVQIVTGVPFTNQGEIVGFMKAMSFSVLGLTLLALLTVLIEVLYGRKPQAAYGR